MTRIRHWFEARLAGALFSGFGALPVDLASAAGSWLGRVVARRLPVTNRARANLARIYPELSTAERERIIVAMWDNLGRTAAEFPHLGEFRVGPGERIVAEGFEQVAHLLDHRGPCLFVTAHVGNWELVGLSLVKLGFGPLTVVYRAATNAGVEWIYRQGREAMGIRLVPKGAAGARLALQSLKEGRHLGLLVDQKMNDGISVPFFGIPAMTAPAVAAFALKFGCPVVPVHIVREGGVRFRVIFEPPLALADIADRKAQALDLMVRVNLLYERWIRERPEQWLWPHNRWPDPS